MYCTDSPVIKTRVGSMSVIINDLPGNLPNTRMEIRAATSVFAGKQTFDVYEANV